MAHSYDDLDPKTQAALGLTRDDLLDKLGTRATFYSSNEWMVQALADQILADYRECLDAGRSQVAMIVPVGPVGQYQLIADRCRAEGISLKQLTLFVMDEYLTDAGQWIPNADPLSFRAHIQRNLLDLLPEDMRPNVIVPDPADPDAVGQEIDRLGGIDVTYAGVGITGHLAFNEPMSGVTNAEYFADLPTRIVPLLPETRLINSVTAARGNMQRIPRVAITVGMREILGARTLRIFMNRHWQSAAIRRLAFGPITAAFPASLAQTHPNWSLHVVDYVLDPPEPELA